MINCFVSAVPIANVVIPSVFQENSWIPNEAVLHFFIGTPKSDLKRDVSVDLNFSVPQKKFRIQFIQPKKKIEIDGRFFS